MCIRDRYMGYQQQQESQQYQQQQPENSTLQNSPRFEHQIIQGCLSQRDHAPDSQKPPRCSGCNTHRENSLKKQITPSEQIKMNQHIDFFNQVNLQEDQCNKKEVLLEQLEHSSPLYRQFLNLQKRSGNVSEKSKSCNKYSEKAHSIQQPQISKVLSPRQCNQQKENIQQQQQIQKQKNSSQQYMQEKQLAFQHSEKLLNAESGSTQPNKQPYLTKQLSQKSVGNRQSTMNQNKFPNKNKSPKVPIYTNIKQIK
eukprot:TRINITY_DN3414_c0_g1_i3.p2 TRINITY_DN3414_c0_g1~~TRINITY_DN3414_c0_g1_i3.p2  ORF type:complete len:254 (-),score=39.61 TRINITY_DN3414_c0_g1_i3:110-871(-)